MLTNWWSVILASSVVAALIGGIFTFFNAARIERLKHEFSARQERAKRLGEAHTDLLAITETAILDLDKAKADPNSVLRTLVSAMTADFSTAEKIYQKVRPLLANAFRSQIDAHLQTAVELNAASSKQLLNEASFDQKSELLNLLKARSEFIAMLKSQIADAYAQVAGA